MGIFSKEHHDQWRFIIGFTKSFQFKIDIEYFLGKISGMWIYFLWFGIFLGFAKGSKGFYIFGLTIGDD